MIRIPGFTGLLFVLCTTAGIGAAELLPPPEKMTPTQRILFTSVPLEKIDTNSGLELLTGFPTAAGNAADHYARLEMLFNEDREAPDKFSIKKRSKGLNEILRAVSIKECRLSPDYYPQMSQGTAKQPDIVVFMAYTQALFNLAKELEEKSDYKGAGAVYRSALIFGWHLTQNPPSLLCQILGTRIKYLAAEQYARFLQRNLDMKRSEAASNYAKNLLKAQEFTTRKLNYFLGNMFGFNCLYSAIRVATADSDPVWRQEAIMRLGVFRHGVPGSDGTIIANDPAQQAIADKALVSITSNASPEYLRQLAAWSIQKLTPESFKKIRENISQVAKGNK